MRSQKKRRNIVHVFRDLFSRTVHIFKTVKENDSEDVWIDSITKSKLVLLGRKITSDNLASIWTNDTWIFFRMKRRTRSFLSISQRRKRKQADGKIFRSRCCAHWLISSLSRENNQESSVSVCRAFELELSQVIVKRISLGVERDLGWFIYILRFS